MTVSKAVMCEMTPMDEGVKPALSQTLAANRLCRGHLLRSIDELIYALNIKIWLP